jgi:acid phosphatase (class A)
MMQTNRIFTVAAVVLLSLTVRAGAAENAPTDFPKLPPGMPAGYLPTADLPDSLALLPPPPEAGSTALARDEDASRAMTRPPESPRWKRAASDADLHFPHGAQTFACAMGVSPGPDTTPVLYRLLQRSLIDVGLSTYRAKNHYQRVRPFVAHGNATCSPGDEAMLRRDGSYPSGHSAVGWGWALLLAEIDPDNADAILQRGRDFGQSRVVCNVHWQSDVEGGRLVASAAVARLHADPAFLADLQSAKAELASARQSGNAAPTDCGLEAESLR